MRSVEQRSKKRHQVDFAACLVWEKRLIETVAINLSQEGALLKGHSHQFPVNATLRICCCIAEKTYDIPGIVIHNTNGNVGIEFKKQQPEFFSAVMQINEQPRAVSAA